MSNTADTGITYGPHRIDSTYTPEQLRELADEEAAAACYENAAQLRAHAAALEENRRQEQVYLTGLAAAKEKFDAELATLREKVRVAEELLQQPTEDMWGGLARDVVMWMQLSHERNTGWTLHEHLNNVGREIPEWLTKEIPSNNSVPAKGTIAVVIFRAMAEPALARLRGDSK